MLLLEPDPTKAMWQLAISSGLLVLTEFGKHAAGATWVYWLLMSIWAAGFLSAAILLMPGSTSLKLDNKGFTITNYFKKRYVSWRDCTEFKIWTSHVIRKREIDMVVFSSGRNGLLGHMIKKQSGEDDFLPEYYGMEPEVLCDLMNERRQKFIENNKNNAPA